MNSPASTASATSFVLGVTGNMDPDFEKLDESVLRDRMNTILLFLRFGGAAADPRNPSNSLGDSLLEILAGPEETRRFATWEGVPEHEDFILLSSFAPGADTLFADAFVELEKTVPGFRGRVRAALPFPPDIYRLCSTFLSNPDSPTESDLQKQAVFDEWMTQLPPEDVFEVFLAEDLDLPLDGQSDVRSRFEEDRHDDERCNLRYQVAGEFVAGYSTLLLSLFDDRFNSLSPAGSNDIVESRLRNSRDTLLPPHGKTPHGELYDWRNCESVLHLYHPRKKTRSVAQRDKTSPPGEGAREGHPLRFLAPYELGPRDDETVALLSNIWNLEERVNDLAHDERDRLLDEFAAWQERGIEHFFASTHGGT